MTNTINLQKIIQLSLIVIGRQGKIRTCVMRSDVRNPKAVNTESDVPEGKTLRQAIMSTIAEKVTELAQKAEDSKKPINVEVYTVGQVAIKYYQMVKFLKGGHRPSPADIEQLSYNNDGTRNNDTVEDSYAYTELAEAIADAIAKGNGVHLQASGNADLFELMIPKDVTVEEGQKLNFVNGVAENGIRARGWANGNRANAEVIVKGTRNPRAYITKAADPKNPWASLDILLTTIDNMCKSLPSADHDKSRDDGTLDDLFGNVA